ncbi:MAG: ParB/RepB/Spo0J family partition protein [Nitrososphaerota archaeon]|nr:ParB/RepB/Spo0J family partition protein [Candidatus Calditenuaceae archaeon]MDW8073941.1 ParB/RepB/Spo0J family partition protein [Nitrososphaerota archaeon]
MKIATVPIGQIHKTSMNPRQVVDRERLEALTTSIRQIGVTQPLILWWNKAHERYEVLDGSRRLEAARLAGLKELPAIIYEVSPEEAMKIAFSIHLSQEDLTPEELLNYIDLMVQREVFRSIEEACRHFGISRSWYYELERAGRIRDESLSVSVRSAVAASDLSEEEKRRVLELAREDGLSSREVRRLIDLCGPLGLDEALRRVVASRPRIVYSDPLTREEVYECAGSIEYRLKLGEGYAVVEAEGSGGIRVPRTDLPVLVNLLRFAEAGKASRRTG